MLQNAEDAKASVVKFLHDEHTYDTNPKHLHHPGLADYQVLYHIIINMASFFCLSLSDMVSLHSDKEIIVINSFYSMCTLCMENAEILSQIIVHCLLL